MERELPHDQIRPGERGLFRGDVEHALRRDLAEPADRDAGEGAREFVHDRGVDDGLREIGMSGDEKRFHKAVPFLFGDGKPVCGPPLI